MNYRHAYHAGNFADCVKHALLVWLLRALARKGTPFAVLDTHAGRGRYDLAAPEAARTGEWRAGIGRLLDDPPPALADYVALVQSLDPAAPSFAAPAATAPTASAPLAHYPGSPLLCRALLRPQDRLMLNELHPEEHAALARLFARDRQTHLHRRDGYECLRALLPPPERRGLVLIDPPFEQPDEFARAAAGLAAGHARFGHGLFMLWYPIKHRTPVRAFHAAVQASGIRDVLAAELALREPTDPARLNGCGVLLVNPPYRFEAEGLAILEALLARLGAGEKGAAVTIQRLAAE